MVSACMLVCFPMISVFADKYYENIIGSPDLSSHKEMV